MLYDEIRDKIRPGDLIAFSNEKWGSKADLQTQIVRIFTRSEYSHVGIAWPIGGRVMILEAVVPRVRIFPLSYLLPFYWMPTQAPWSNDVEEYALARVGESYSKLEAIRGFFGLTRDNRRWQCAEYVRSILNRAGVPLDGPDTPTALVQEIMALDIPQFMVTK